MKLKYLAGLAAVSVFGLATLTSCGPSAEEAAPDATGEVAPPDATAPDAAAPDAAASPSPAPATP
jgi:hypothetical protein